MPINYTGEIVDNFSFPLFTSSPCLGPTERVDELLQVWQGFRRGAPTRLLVRWGSGATAKYWSAEHFLLFIYGAFIASWVEPTAKKLIVAGGSPITAQRASKGDPVFVLNGTTQDKLSQLGMLYAATPRDVNTPYSLRYRAQDCLIESAYDLGYIREGMLFQESHAIGPIVSTLELARKAPEAGAPEGPLPFTPAEPAAPPGGWRYSDYGGD